MMLFFLALLAAILGLTWSGLEFTDALIAASAAIIEYRPRISIGGRPAGGLCLS